MRTPDARPVGETAEQRALRALLDTIDSCSGALKPRLDGYRDAVAAEARAALLRDAPVLFVATDKLTGDPKRASSVFATEVTRNDTPFGLFMGPNGEPQPFLMLNDQLTPPGTVRRYALVPLEEEGRDG